MSTGNVMASEEQGLVLTRVLARRGNSCSRYGRIQSTLRSGGVPTDLRSRCASWTQGPVAPSAFTCADLTAPSIR